MTPDPDDIRIRGRMLGLEYDLAANLPVETVYLRPAVYKGRWIGRRQHEVQFIPAGQSAPAPVVKIGRNDPCPCGSGKKHKKCCMR